MRKAVSVLLTILVLGSSFKQEAEAFFGSGGEALEVTQLLNEVHLGIIEAESLIMGDWAEICQLPLDGDAYRDFQQLMDMIEKTREVIKEADNLCYAIDNIDEVWKTKFTGYKGIVDSLAISNPSGAVDGLVYFGDMLRQWNDDNLKNLKQTMEACNEQAEQLDKDVDELKRKQNKLKIIEGDTKINKMHAEFTAFNGEQLMKIKEMLMILHQTIAPHLAMQTDRQAKEDAEGQKILENLKLEVTDLSKPVYRKKPLIGPTQ